MGVHLFIQCGIAALDPGQVHAALQSLEQGMDDERAAAVFEELRRVPPTVQVIAEACHDVSTGNASDRQQGMPDTDTVIDHTEQANFSFASWTDVSGHVAGLDKYKTASVEVVA